MTLPTNKQTKTIRARRDKEAMMTDDDKKRSKPPLSIRVSYANPEKRGEMYAVILSATVRRGGTLVEGVDVKFDVNFKHAADGTTNEDGVARVEILDLKEWPNKISATIEGTSRKSETTIPHPPTPKAPQPDKLDADIIGNTLCVCVMTSEYAPVKGWRVDVFEEWTGKQLTDNTSVTDDRGVLIVHLCGFTKERPRFILKVPPFKDKILTGKGPRPEEPRLPTFGEVRARVEEENIRLRRPFQAWKLGRTMNRERGGM